MRVTIDLQQENILANAFADDVHTVVQFRNFRLAGNLETENVWDVFIPRWRALLHSIPNDYERRLFVRSVRNAFLRIRREKGTEIRGRDYAAKIKPYTH